MLRVVLTGNAGAGKTTVAKFLTGLGATIIDADAIVRELQASGSPYLGKLADAFGLDIITQSGSLDRARLRRIILQDESARKRLNAMLHPAVHRRRSELEAEARESGAAVVVHDIPLFFELMNPADFPVVILVDADEGVRMKRLTARGLSKEEAVALMATQMDPSQKRRGATHVIENNGTLAALRERTAEVWNDVIDTAKHQLDRE
jgi:dephospho-CoA kinase